MLVDQRSLTEAESAERAERFPVGAAVTFADLQDAGREGVIDHLRETEPVTWLPALGGWLVTAHAPAREALSARTATTVEARQNLVRHSLGTMMLTVDGEEQKRMRKPLEPPFRVQTVADRFAPAIRDLVDELVDDLIAGSGSGEAELGRAFAAPYAVRMAGRALGLALDDVPRIDGFYAAFAGAMVYDGDPEPQRRADDARAELDDLLHAELARSRRTPGTSLTSALAHDSQGLTDDEVVAQLRVVMFGAIETIQASVMSTLLLLLQHPDQCAQVLADPALLDAAGEEARRVIPPVAFVERWTREPITLGGVAIPGAEFVGVSVVGANRDPAVFDDPLAFDLHRPNAQRSLSFSYGPHACLGIHLARLQTSLAVSGILTRLAGLTLAAFDPPEGFAFRRPGTLTVRWSR